jgi:hypothetical protein
MLVVPTVFHRKDQVDHERQQREQHKIEEFSFACHNPPATDQPFKPTRLRKKMSQSVCRTDSLIPPSILIVDAGS